MLKNNVTVVIFFLTGFLFASFAQNTADPEITVDELRDHVYYLADDKMEGRKPGLPGHELAVEYILNDLKTSGGKFFNDNGIQHFSIDLAVKPGENNAFSFEDKEFQPGVDFQPLPFISEGSLTAEVVFAGYGFDFDKDGIIWNDYQAIDPADKWVLLMTGSPEPNNPDSYYQTYQKLSKKILTAKDHGAAGVLVVNPPDVTGKDQLYDISKMNDRTNTGLPVIQITRAVANQLLEKSGTTIDSLEKSLNSSLQPASFDPGITVSGKTAIDVVKADAGNIIAYFEGSDPVLKDEYIILGAHFDHLGYGGPGSGSREPNSKGIHNGADDNASGVAGILEIFEKLASADKKPKRSVILVAFDGEEMGLLGSKQFTLEPPVDISKVKAMVNIDMIGSMDNEDKSISIGGTGTEADFETLLNSVTSEDSLTFKMSPEGFGPSDHASFYAKDIPVLFFYAGAKTTYHTPADDAEFLNYEGMKIITDFIYNTLYKLADRNDSFVFQEAGPKDGGGGRRMNLKVTLGIMPDVSGSTEGLRADAVIEGKPAYLAGMEKGDIIIEIDGKPINDIYEYMDRLSELSPGQRVSVVVLRDGKEKVLIVEL